MKFRSFLSVLIFSLLPLLSHAEVTVLTYHTISDKKNNMATTFSTFQSQINYLISKHVIFIDSKKLVQSIIEHKELPNNTVVLTFDDGWKNQTLAMEFLSKNHIPATFALVTQFQKVNSSTGIQKEDFLKFKNAPFIYVNHSFTHNVKDYLKHPLDDLNKSEVELNKLKLLNIDIEPFYVYPYGKKNKSLVNGLKQYNYIAAFGVDSFKFSTLHVDIYNIPRFLVNESTDLTKLF